MLTSFHQDSHCENNGKYVSTLRCIGGTLFILWNIWTSKWNFLQCCQCFWLSLPPLSEYLLYIPHSDLLTSTRRVWWTNQENLRRSSHSHIQTYSLLLHIQLYLVSHFDFLPLTQCPKQFPAIYMKPVSITLCSNRQSLPIKTFMLKIVIIKAMSQNKQCVMALWKIIRL